MTVEEIAAEELRRAREAWRAGDLAISNHNYRKAAQLHRIGDAHARNAAHLLEQQP